MIVTSGDFDLAKQQSQIDNFIVQHVDAIIVCPVDSKGIGPAIEEGERREDPGLHRRYRRPGWTRSSSARGLGQRGEVGALAAEYIAKVISEKLGEVGIIT